jgi:multiple sugar transport system substrate-binding protein
MCKRRWAGVLTAVILVALLSTPVFAGGDEEVEEGVGAMTYWSPFGGDSLTWDQWRIDEFHAANPDIQIEMVATPSGGITNGKLLAAIAGGDPPDIVLSDNASAAYSFAANGTALPWDPYVDVLAVNLDDLLDGLKGVTQIDGQTFLIPQDTNVIMLYMNVDLFEAAGLDVNNPPTTIAELDAMAAQLDSFQGNDIDRFGFIPWLDYGNDNQFYWPWMFGATVYDTETGELNIDSQEMVDVYTWMNSYAQKTSPTQMQGFASAFGSMFSPDHPFMTGRVAMDVTGNWFTNALRIYAPDINYAVAKVPAPAGGRPGGTVFQSNVFMLPSGAERPDLAVEWFNWCQNVEMLANDFDVWRSIPITDAQFDVVSHTISGDSIYKIEREMANSPNSGTPGLTRVGAQLADDLSALRDDVIYNDRDPLPLLQGLQQKFEAELAN